MEGWIKLHRQLLEWEWYDEPDTFRLFLHCLLKANHKDNNYRGQIVKAGSFLTSRELLSNETGLSIQKVRTSLERLELTKEITTKKSKKGTVLQIVKYKNYQGANQEDNQQNNQQSNQIVTNKQPTVNQIVTTNNNDKKEKNEKNDNKKSENIIIPSSSDSLNKSIGDKKTINNYDYKQIITSSSNQGKLRNLFVDIKHNYNGWEDVQIHGHLDQAMNNYATHYRIKKLNIIDDKHLMNSFVLFAKKHWGKNDTNIRNLK
jgi:hypothetical protein